MWQSSPTHSRWGDCRCWRYSAFAAGMLILVHAAGDFMVKLVTTRTIRGVGFRAALIGSAALFAVTVAACATFDRATPLAVILPILFVGGACRSMQMTAQTAFQFADVRAEDQLAEQAEHCPFFRHAVEGAGQVLGVELGEDVVRGP